MITGKAYQTRLSIRAPSPSVKGAEYRDRSTGVGLPLAKLIMEAHGGELILGNKAAGGASLIMKFVRE